MFDFVCNSCLGFGLNFKHNSAAFIVFSVLIFALRMILCLLNIYLIFTDHHVSSVRHERGKRLWFNVSEVPVADNIVGAELRIFQNVNYSKRLDVVYTVTVFQLIRADSGYVPTVYYILFYVI